LSRSVQLAPRTRAGVQDRLIVSCDFTTCAAPLDAARWATRTTIGIPPMSASGLRGSRLDASRAGISATNASSSCGPLTGIRRLRLIDAAALAFEQHRMPSRSDTPDRLAREINSWLRGRRPAGLW